MRGLAGGIGRRDVERVLSAGGQTGTVAAAPVTDATIVVPRYTLYPVAPAEPIRDSETLVVVVPAMVSAVGAAGVVTVPPGPFSVTSSAKYVPWAYQPCRYVCADADDAVNVVDSGDQPAAAGVQVDAPPVTPRNT